LILGIALLVSVVIYLTLPDVPVEEPEPVIPIEDILQQLYEEYETHITPKTHNITNLTKQILPGTNFTDVQMSVLQDWISRNINHTGDFELRGPVETLKDAEGNHISLHLLEYSMILSKEPDIDAYLLLVDLKYLGDKEPRNHSAILVFFDDKVFLSDLTIRTKDLSYVCRISLPVDVMFNILDINYIEMYNIKYALKDNESISFQSNSEFTAWMEQKTGGI